MKQMSDVETTTSSRPPLPSPLMGFPRRGVVRTICFYHTWPGASSRGPMHANDFYDRHPISEAQVLAALGRRRGGDLSRLTPDELFEFDQDHYGGLAAVDALARRAGITAASRVLDVCAGLAGPARFLASR